MELGNELFTPGDTGTLNWLNPVQEPFEQWIAEEFILERYVYKT